MFLVFPPTATYENNDFSHGSRKDALIVIVIYTIKTSLIQPSFSKSISKVYRLVRMNTLYEK